MSNYNFSPTLDGLNNIDSNNVNSDSIITDYLTVNKDSSVPTLSLDNSTNSIASTAFVQSVLKNNLSNIAKLNTNNIFTADNIFQTTIIDDDPIQIVYTGSIPNNAIQFAPKVSNSTFNPYCLDDDTFIGADTIGSLVVGKRDRYSAIKFTDTSLYIFGPNELNIIVNDLPAAIFDSNANLSIIGSFISSFSTPSATYENQFAGDIWTLKGLSCKNGLYIQNNITPGSTTYASINSTGGAILTSLSCPTITTTTQTNTDNSTKCATTAFVKNQGYITSSVLTNYAELSGLPQTFSNSNTFTQSIIGVTEATSDNSTKVSTTAFVKNQGYITNAALTGYALLSGLPQTFSNSNTFSQSITGVTEATADNSTKVATTAFVKNQGYSILNASNSFTGQQSLTNSGINFALRVKSSTAVTSREECHFIATGNGSYNSIVTANDSVILARDTATMDLGTLCLTTHSNTSCGIRITNSEVLMTGTNIKTNGILQTNGNLNINNSITGPATSYAITSAHIGYVNTITSFTTPTGTGINTLGTYIWDNSGNYAYGTYQIVANIRATPSVAGVSIRLAFQTVNTVITGLYGDSQQTITVGPNILKIVATLKIYSTQTWYLLFQCGTTYTFNSAACSLDIIRIA